MPSERIEILVKLPYNLNFTPSIHQSTHYLDIQRAVGGGNFDILRREWRGEELDFFFYDDRGVEDMEENRYCQALFDVTLRGVVLLGGGADEEGNTKPVNPLTMSHIMRFMHHRNNTPS